MKIVSACLAGLKCAYDGQDRAHSKVIELVKKGEAIPVCPEQLGGLPTPRIPSERSNNKVINREGIDVTENFEKGAQEALKLTRMARCESAIVKSRSPSCGHGKIYDGTFSGKLIQGNGIFADLLLEEGIEIITEEEL